MNNILQSINISKDFTDAPWARFRTDGNFSGQEFYEDIVRPKYKSVIDTDKKGKLFIDMDDTYGYWPSFLSETFWRLCAEFWRDDVWKHLEIKSDDNKLLIELIHEYANEYQESKK